MRQLSVALAITALFVVSGSVLAAPESAYTKLDFDKACVVTDKAGDDGGDFINYKCEGYKTYPVFVYYSDARESVFYGFQHESGDPRWESFQIFNNTSNTIEWRIDGDVPFATIHRWSVADMSGEGTKPDFEVLVVEKVGQPDAMEGCVVGYVVATGNPGHNVQARDIADQNARGFKCGTDEPIIREGSVPLPPPTSN